MFAVPEISAEKGKFAIATSIAGTHHRMSRGASFICTLKKPRISHMTASEYMATLSATRGNVSRHSLSHTLSAEYVIGTKNITMNAATLKTRNAVAVIFIFLLIKKLYKII